MTRTTLPRGGVQLTPEQSVRLAMLDNVSRERAIEAIVSHIRKASKLHPNVGRNTPRHWYLAPI